MNMQWQIILILLLITASKYAFLPTKILRLYLSIPFLLMNEIKSFRQCTFCTHFVLFRLFFVHKALAFFKIYYLFQVESFPIYFFSLQVNVLS